ncbi:MAG: ribonuclease H-like domain-containing protein [Candidatus Colwellbacteria bacterium]|nr:ribonuclease H-like domain-containing protein [Candidatus Colwellbacteria bacterium]
MRDRLVIDIETKNTFDDVGGKENLKDLEASLVCVYSYNAKDFLSFREDRIGALGPVLQNAGLIIGFSINRFDMPILNKYFNFNLMSLPTLDLLEKIEASYGRRIGLDLLAKTNLGVGKTNHSLDAIKFYSAGDWESLEKYCLNDVLITRDLYELAKRQGYLLVPERWSNNPVKVPLAIKDIIEESNTLF